MNLETFIHSLVQSSPDENYAEPLKALWWDAQGDWDKAHHIAQKQEGSKNYDLVHAYLHRKEGDKWNASYWYNRCGKTLPSLSLQEEWKQLVVLFLQSKP